MTDKVLLLSKDATLPEYFEPYGGKYWKTPNISELAQKGTIFRRHYTVAPSTAMAFNGMFTGKLPLETDNSDYREVEKSAQETLFDRFYLRGYACHLIWSSNYVYMAEKYSKCYGEHTVHHDTLKLNQSVGPHKSLADEKIENNEELAEETLSKIVKLVEEIVGDNHKLFLWIHVPHVMLGRNGYGGDIDLFDRLVGEMRKLFPDEGIYITADHGHMNLTRGKTCYGFDVYEKAIRIPLITPRIGDAAEILYPTSNQQLPNIILDCRVDEKKFIVSDSAFYAQPHRKMAIITGRYKYIYNKATGLEELYDIVWDAHEENNLLVKYVYDKDRHKKIVKDQVVFYPYHDSAKVAYAELHDYFVKIWRNGSVKQELRNRVVIPFRRIRTIYRDIVKEIRIIMSK